MVYTPMWNNLLVISKKREEHKVYKLKRDLYGLKHAPRDWYTRITSYFIQHGFQRCPYEHTLYCELTIQGDVLIVCLYVDDLIFTNSSLKTVSDFWEAMIRFFYMTYLGLMSNFLGIERFIKRIMESIFHKRNMLVIF